MTLNRPDNPLADELFRLVEAPAGYAHISDGIDALSDLEILELADRARDHHEFCVRLLNAFTLHHSKRIALKRPYMPLPAGKTPSRRQAKPM